METLNLQVTAIVNSYMNDKAREFISAINEKYETVSVEDITQMWKDILKSSGGIPEAGKKKKIKKLVTGKSSWNIFCSKFRPSVKEELEKSEPSLAGKELNSRIAKELSKRWKLLSQEEKDEYKSDAKKKVNDLPDGSGEGLNPEI